MKDSQPDVRYNGVVEIEMGGHQLMVHFQYIPHPPELAMSHEPLELFLYDGCGVIRMQHNGLDITDMLVEAAGGDEAELWNTVMGWVDDGAGYEYIARPGDEVVDEQPGEQSS